MRASSVPATRHRCFATLVLGLAIGAGAAAVAGIEPWAWLVAADLFRDHFESGNVVRRSQVLPF